MTIASIICFVVAAIACSVAVCFQEKNKPLSLFLNILLSASLVCLAIVSSATNNFSTYSILIILSVLLLQAPLIKNILEVDFKKDKTENKQNAETANSTEIVQKNFSQNVQNSNILQKSEINTQKFRKKAPKWLSWAIDGCLCVSAFLMAFSALYLGRETAYGFLIALAIGAFLMFLDAIIKKNPKFTSKTEGLLFYSYRLLIFTTAGLYLGQIVPVLVYSLALKNILFCLSLLCYATYTLLRHFLPNKYNHLLTLAATLFLLSTLLV